MDEAIPAEEQVGVGERIVGKVKHPKLYETMELSQNMCIVLNNGWDDVAADVPLVCRFSG